MERGKRGLVDRLNAGETILCAEGYLLALSRMGYLSRGVWVPEFILEHPEVLRTVHYEFTHAGTDVTEAFQYYTHREKMREIGREEDLEEINRIALRVAKQVADETGTLLAGCVTKTCTYTGTLENRKELREIFDEQVRWSKEEGADYIIAETLLYLGEAEIVLDVIKSHGLPAVVSFADRRACMRTMDDVPIAKACKTILEQGATLVGVNCSHGPDTMLEVVKEIVKEVPPEKVCALPVAYRTTKEEPTFFHLTDKHCPANNPVFPHGLDAFQVCQAEIVQFTKQCVELGLKYIGICCGNAGVYTRAMAETLGRKPAASRYHDPTKRGYSLEKLIKKN